MHSSFNKACLLFAVVLVHPPAQLILDVSPIVSAQQWLIERDANERIELQGLSSLNSKLFSVHFCRHDFCVYLTLCLCLMLTSRLCFNMLLNVHALSAVLLLSYSILN